MIGEVHKSQCNNWNDAVVYEVEVGKGRRVCLPNWQAVHNGDVDFLLHVAGSSKGK